jgi:hypothetical protein
MNNLSLETKIEIWNYRYEGIWYEIHVNATEQRFIKEVFAETGEVTAELLAHFEEVIDNINH